MTNEETLELCKQHIEISTKLARRYRELAEEESLLANGLTTILALLDSCPPANAMYETLLSALDVLVTVEREDIPAQEFDPDGNCTNGDCPIEHMCPACDKADTEWLYGVHATEQAFKDSGEPDFTIWLANQPKE